MSDATRSDVDLLAPPNEMSVDRAIRAFVEAVRERYRHRLKAVYLFGSRARGDFGPFSDVDIALVFAGSEWRSFQEKKALSDIAYDVMLETSAQIQAWPFEMREWDKSNESASTGLVKAVKRDGKLLWSAP